MAVDLKAYHDAYALLNRADMVELLRNLVRIRSPFFEEAEIINYLHGRLSATSNLQTEIHHFEENLITGFRGENLIVRYPGKGYGPKLLLNAHVDTVPLCDGWTVDPYAGVEEDGKLYGLGALDMKAGVVIAVFVMEALAHAGVELAGDLIFTAVSDEEGPFGLGTHFTIVDQIISDCDYAIVTEATGPFAASDERFPCAALGSRGNAVYFVAVRGRSAHGANPERGVNAVEDAARLIIALNDHLDLGSHPLLGDGTMSITNLYGGSKYLLVPEEAGFTIYRHTVEGDAEKALREVREIAASLNLKSEVEINLREQPHPDLFYMPWTVDENNILVQSLKLASEAVLQKKMMTTYFRAESDANHIASRLRIPTVLFGPDGANFHAPDEYVKIDTMVDSARTLLFAIMNLLS